jgi:hypothetical protein
MKKILFTFIYFISMAAQAQQGMCFKQEINPATSKPFTSEQEWQNELDNWEEAAPRTAGLLSLWKAYSLFTNEKDMARKMGTDKTAHCYLGCRISQETDYETADYVGWLKEQRDLKDCNINTHFDDLDYKATQKGAELGETQIDAKSCQEACKQLYR